jgi:ribosome-associated toxin RatA of RatAB toxin-antitoxin module
LGQEEKRLLAKGRVIILEQSHGQPKGRVEAAILIDAPVERVWSAMVDCDRAPDFVPGLKGCRVLRRDGNSLIIEHQVRVSWLLPMVTYVFRADYQRYKRIDFKRVSGGLKELEGSWALENINGGRQTIVMYSVYLDPGFYVPQWLVRLILKGDLPDLLTALRNRVSVSSQR